MKKTILTTAIAATILSLSATAYAEDKMEECMSAAGVKVMVPAGECAKMQKDDFSGVSEEVKAQFKGEATPSN